jgi:uncharacterized protein
VRLSAFNLYIDDYPRPGDTLIHNTFSGAYVVLEDEIVAALRRADRGEAPSEATLETVRDLELLDPDVGVCVESRKSEAAEFRGWFERRRSGTDMSVIVGVNLACNFDCPYCCQAEVMSGKVMTPELCDATARWIAGRATEIGAARVSLTFVGGEPLLHPGRIKRIAGAVRQALPEDVDVGFTLITNGYFLDEAMLEDLLPHGLAGAQITLDGDERTHHLTRVSKKGENTFQRIFDNMLAASRHIRINVNGNYQDNTVHGFGPLIEKLAAAGLPEGSKVRFSPALEALSSESGVGSGSCTFSGSDMRYQTGFHDAAVAAGYDFGELHAVGPCAFHERHAFSIDPDGTILKCPGFMGHGADWGIGHVESGLGPRYQQLVDINPQRECGSCVHLPNCGGGCVAAQWLELGRPEGVNCEHEYFESVKRDGVIRSYLLASEDSREAAVARFPGTTPLPREPALANGRGIRPSSLSVLAS